MQSKVESGCGEQECKNTIRKSTNAWKRRKDNRKVEMGGLKKHGAKVDWMNKNFGALFGRPLVFTFE